ncbi:hypothetical protein GFY24_00845 [Nocardia sp. SYP-A9097]|uniref:hypothetical protein n=1 Tax=Nocardia sp. SYP-A9097 TaxID=2663237 RepID=UPI00129C02BD|nr:hypothetical protein [Nocardia sp. SYP-A9097]MRH86025.1 hypothetical protein [Nocardia sp. SYP-A9097]
MSDAYQLMGPTGPVVRALLLRHLASIFPAWTVHDDPLAPAPLPVRCPPLGRVAVLPALTLTQTEQLDNAAWAAVHGRIRLWNSRWRLLADFVRPVAARFTNRGGSITLPGNVQPPDGTTVFLDRAGTRWAGQMHEGRLLHLSELVRAWPTWASPFLGGPVFTTPERPHFYRPPRPQLPAGESARRLALPWGDSAYTSLTHVGWLPGDPAPDPESRWDFGPPLTLTPSSEGPRRRYQAEWRHLSGYFPAVRRPYMHQQFPLAPGDRVGWIDTDSALQIDIVGRPRPVDSEAWKRFSAAVAAISVLVDEIACDTTGEANP